jgi:hypothetical protein
MAVGGERPGWKQEEATLPAGEWTGTLSRLPSLPSPGQHLLPLLPFPQFDLVSWGKQMIHVIRHDTI